MLAQPSSLAGYLSSMLLHVENTRGAVICSISILPHSAPVPASNKALSHAIQRTIPLSHCPTIHKTPSLHLTASPFPPCHTARCDTHVARSASCHPCFAYRSNNEHLHPEQGRHLAPPYRRLHTALPGELQLHTTSAKLKPNQNGGCRHAPILSVNLIGAHTRARAHTHTPCVSCLQDRALPPSPLLSDRCVCAAPDCASAHDPEKAFTKRARQHAVSISEKQWHDGQHILPSHSPRG